MVISYSNLSKALKCKLQWHYKKERKTPDRDPNESYKNQFIGHLLQKAVEKFYLERWYKILDQVELEKVFRHLIENYAFTLTEQIGIAWNEGELQSWIDIANETTPKIISVIRTERLLSVGSKSEFELVLPVRDHTVHGRADFILPAVKGSDFYVLDGKGGQTYGKYTDANQLLMYGLGAELEFKRFPDRFGFWWFRFGKIQWKKFTESHKKIFFDSVAATLDALDLKDYSPTPGSHCRLCDYRSQCEAGRLYLLSKATAVADLDLGDNAAFVSL